MVQKREGTEPRRRGRPRAYDPEAALQSALEAFWSAGYSGTSLDDIAGATGMNRPSLYAAFGDKHDLYVKALNRYWTLGFEEMRNALANARPVSEEIMDVYERALSIYFSGDGPPRGCFAIGTATTEAVLHPDIRSAFATGLETLDKAFEERLRAAREKGELRHDADPEALAMLASSTLHTLAIRARMGTPRAALRRLAQKAVGVICEGPAKEGGR